MIFNEFSYFALFLILSGRPLSLGGLWGALCVLLFVWKMVTSRAHTGRAHAGLFGMVQAAMIMFAFEYLTFAC